MVLPGPTGVSRSNSLDRKPEACLGGGFQLVTRGSER